VRSTIQLKHLEALKFLVFVLRFLHRGVKLCLLNLLIT
jgi:hypothetical protein